MDTVEPATFIHMPTRQRGLVRQKATSGGWMLERPIVGAASRFASQPGRASPSAAVGNVGIAANHRVQPEFHDVALCRLAEIAAT
jgi:hypothetical protein